MDEPLHGPSDDEVRALREIDPAPDTAAPAALRARVIGFAAETSPTAHRRWLMPVAAVGAVVAVAGAYLWGANGIDVTPVPAALTVATGSATDPGAPIGRGDGDGLGQGGLALQSVPEAVFPWRIGGHQRFTLPAFDEATGEASVYTIDPRAVYSVETAAALAASLGVSGEVRDQPHAHGWTVGDPTGPSLGLSWGFVSYYGGLPAPVTVCEEQATALHGRNTADFGQEMIRCMADTPLPDDEAVRQMVSTFLAAVGIDEAATTVTLTPDDAGREVMATAARIVADNVTEILARVTVTTAGIQHASASIGEVVSLGAYPIVSAAEAAARLNDPAFSPRQTSGAEGAEESGLESTASEPPAFVPPAVPVAGAPVPWSIAEREIVSGRLGLMLLSGADGVQYLAPAYEFTATDGSTWSVIALAEDRLDTTQQAGFGVWPG